MHIWEDCNILQPCTTYVEFHCILNLILKDFSLDEETIFFQNTFP